MYNPAFDPRVKFGIPAAAGVALAAGAAANDGTPLETIGAGLGGAAGGAAGLVAARSLAGKYNPQLIQRAQKAVSRAGNAVGDYGRNLPEGSRVRKGVADAMADGISLIDNRGFGVAGERNAMIPFPTQGVQQNVQKGLSTVLVPAAGASAALGGVAAGQAGGALLEAMGMGIDPEMPGSSNTVNSRLSMQSAMLPMY